MMLVQIPAIDAVSVPALPSLPSLSFNLGIVSTLAKPSTWIVLLASLVILSSIRAALLYIRPPTWTEASKRVSYVSIIVKEKETPVGASPSASIPGGGGVGSQAASKEKMSAVNASEASQTKKMSSWLWGLVKWDSLPPAAAIAERGGWQPPSSPQMQQIQRQQTRRQRPSFEQPLPALYESQVPVSMAKMIMSRHTFRRPASRPPPVRATNVPQYQRRMPSMV
ncbi:hypothetical protein CPC08DRAFT_118058 [Agrocybe pediades]|nr:hypothetical protein CPC08DRAFT_118058 [Agrocybe pediades]